MTDTAATIVYVNPEFVRVYGYTPSEIVGRTTPRILKRRHGQRAGIHRRVAAPPLIGDNREIAGFLAVQRDITERKQLKQQFLQEQKMEAVGHLAGGIAHDFNNLLTAILGYSELLLEGMGHTDPDRSDVEQICQAGRSAASLTRRLLAFSRRQIFQPSVLNLNDIVSDSRQILDRVIGEDVQLVLQAGSY